MNITKNKKKDVEKLITENPERFKVTTFSGGITPREGQVVQVDGETGTVIAVDQPERDRCVVDMDLGRTVTNHISSSTKEKFSIIDKLTEIFGSFVTFPVNEVLTDGAPGRDLIVMQLEGWPFSLIGETADICLENLGQFLDMDIERLTGTERFRSYINQIKE